ncbi:hypothetical protein RRG08_035893 [Elysia crispata]|uniref:Uncharacterized protein n=1 Tax=Elysia crispata TaxID=231223 RepID=A0AAE1A294_9GAST|nr:hypothetical protein RRG08_035893 [Elysia crispata]
MCCSQRAGGRFRERHSGGKNETTQRSSSNVCLGESTWQRLCRVSSPHKQRTRKLSSDAKIDQREVLVVTHQNDNKAPLPTFLDSPFATRNRSEEPVTSEAKN